MALYRLSVNIVLKMYQTLRGLVSKNFALWGLLYKFPQDTLYELAHTGTKPCYPTRVTNVVGTWHFNHRICVLKAALDHQKHDKLHLFRKSSELKQCHSEMNSKTSNKLLLVGQCFHCKYSSD